MIIERPVDRAWRNVRRHEYRGHSYAEPREVERRVFGRLATGPSLPIRVHGDWRMDVSVVAIPQGPFYEQFGAKLAEARQRADITQEALSKAVGLSRTSIVNIEKGRQPVLLHVVAKMAATLGVAPAVLIPDASVIRFTELPPDLGKVSERNRPWVERIFSSPVQKESGREAKIRSGPPQSGGTTPSGKRQKNARPD